MTIEEINKWLDNEYGVSYTKLEELHDFYFEKYCDLKEQNKRYKEVIDKIKECINEFPIIHYSNIDKVNKKRLSGKLIPVDELLDILKEVE